MASKEISSELGAGTLSSNMEVDGIVTTITPSEGGTTMAGLEIPRRRTNLDETLQSVRSRLSFPSGGMFGSGTSPIRRAAGTTTVGSMFSPMPPPPNTSFFSPSITTHSQAMPSTVGITLPPTSESGGSLQAGPSSKMVTIPEDHLVEILKLASQATQATPPPPPPPVPTSTYWLSQLTAALRPVPITPPPSPVPTAMESLMALMVEQLKQQQAPPAPIPEPPNPAKELLKMLKVLSGEEPEGSVREARIPRSSSKCKFCKWIANYPFPNSQQVPPVVGTYDGTRDPEDHLALYDQAVLTEKWVDPVACHLFPGTLQGYD